MVVVVLVLVGHKVLDQQTLVQLPWPGHYVPGEKATDANYPATNNHGKYKQCGAKYVRVYVSSGGRPKPRVRPLPPQVVMVLVVGLLVVQKVMPLLSLQLRLDFWFLGPEKKLQFSHVQRVEC